MSAKHFKEKKHRWAVDTGDGVFLGTAFPWSMSPVDTALFRTKAEATEVSRMHRDEFPDARPVKVEIKYEVVS